MRRLGRLAFFLVPPPKIPCVFWMRYLHDELSYPRIREDSLKSNLLAQTILPFIEISGRDNSQTTDLVQRLGKIARQIDALPNNAKMYWAAKPENALPFPKRWGG